MCCPLARGFLAAAVIATAAVLAATASRLPAAQDAKTGFLKKTFKNADGTESPYVVFVPAAYNGTKEYPVILFLHGAGETKGGSKQPVEVGIGPAIKKREKDFPFITVIPQSEKRTWKAESDDGKRAIAILDAVMKDYKCDPKRQYLTGLSMGGFGTWSLAAAYPDRFAAIIPICGGGSPTSARKLKDVPVWVFHGGKDTTVKPERSEVMVKALKDAGSTKVKFTLYPDAGHDSWTATYRDAKVWEWLLSQKRPGKKE